MNLFNQSVFLKALGWALIDSLWQTAVLWLFYILITRNGKKFSSRQRHSLAILSLAGSFAWFLINLGVQVYQRAAAPTVHTVFVHNGESAGLSASFTSVLQQYIEPALPVLSAAYLLVTIFLFSRLYRKYHQTRLFIRREQVKVPATLRMFVQQMTTRMGISKKIQVGLSKWVDTPLTFGFWKPVILLPIAAVNHLSTQQVEAIILHELNHIRCNDYLVNLLIACTEIILFFNPFARIFSNIIQKERENSCDDFVLQFRYSAREYARALLVLEQSRTHAHPLVMAATGKNTQLLLHRVKRILTRKPVSTPVNQKLVAYFCSVLLIGVIGWSNPGQVIIKTIHQAQAKKDIINSRSNELTGHFTYPDKEKNNKITAVQHAATTAPKVLPGHPSPAIMDDEPGGLTMQAPEVSLVTPVLYLQQPDENNRTLVLQATENHARAYSLPAEDASTKNNSGAVIAVGSPYPIVPSSSFQYYYTEDTSLPKKYIPTISELKAQETLEKAMEALNEIDWQKLEKEMAASGQKIDIVKLQQELKKAMENIDWKKINDQVMASAQNNAYAFKDPELLQAQMEQLQRALQIRQEKFKKAEQDILQDRLHWQQEEIRNQQKSQTKKKKIVVI